jgi:hypothetical protein
VVPPHQNRDAFPTTTTMVTPQQQEALNTQGRVDLAIQAHKQGHIKSFRAAVAIYDVPWSTAIQRVAGITPQRGSIVPNRRLTPAEEESLKQWILLID